MDLAFCFSYASTLISFLIFRYSCAFNILSAAGSDSLICVSVAQFWVYTTFRTGDVNRISIGSGTNIQDNSLVHVAKSNLAGKVLPTIIGDNVTVGE